MFELLFIILIFFDAIITRIIILISFSDCSLLVDTNKSDFCILTLYHINLLKSFVIVLCV